MAVTTLQQHIEIDQNIVNGKPRIAGRRITVQNIVIWHEYMGYNVDQITAEYDLSLAEIYAALAYYYDHQQEIDEQIKESEAFIEALRKQIPSKVKFVSCYHFDLIEKFQEDDIKWALEQKEIKPMKGVNHGFPKE